MIRNIFIILSLFTVFLFGQDRKIYLDSLFLKKGSNYINRTTAFDSIGRVADDSVTRSKIANGAVGTTELDNNSVTTSKIVDNNVTTGKIAAGNVTNSELADSSVTNSKIYPNNIRGSRIYDGTLEAVDMSTSIRDKLNENDARDWQYSLDNLNRSGAYIYIDTEDLSVQSYVSAPTYTPTLWHHDGQYNRLYFLWHSDAGATATADTTTNYVQWYDIEGDSVSDKVDVGPSWDEDSGHHSGVLMVTDSGYVLAAYDSIMTADNHNRGVHIKRTSNVEDITSWDSVYVTELSAGTRAYGSYPKFVQAGDNIFMIMRYGNASSNHYRSRIYKSTDEGLNWDYGLMLENYSDRQAAEGANTWSYGKLLHPFDTDTMYYIGHIRNYGWNAGYGSAYSHLFLFKSADGVNWYNMDKSFTINLNDSAITCSTAIDYCLVDSGKTTSDEIFWPSGIEFNNVPYMLYSERTETRTYQIPWFAYYDHSSSSWVKKRMVDRTGAQLIDSTYSYRTVFVGLMATDENTFDCFIRNTSATPDRIDQYRTTNKGNSWSIVRNIVIDSISTYEQTWGMEWNGDVNVGDDKMWLYGNYDMGDYSDAWILEFARKEIPTRYGEILNVELYPTTADSMRFILRNTVDSSKDTTEWIGLH